MWVLVIIIKLAAASGDIDEALVKETTTAGIQALDDYYP